MDRRQWGVEKKLRERGDGSHVAMVSSQTRTGCVVTPKPPGCPRKQHLIKYLNYKDCIVAYCSAKNCSQTVQR